MYHILSIMLLTRVIPFSHFSLNLTASYFELNPFELSHACFATSEISKSHPGLSLAKTWKHIFVMARIYRLLAHGPRIVTVWSTVQESCLCGPRSKNRACMAHGRRIVPVWPTVEESCLCGPRSKNHARVVRGPRILPVWSAV